MICSKCNHSVPNDAKICPNCNSDMSLQEKRCPQCWAKLTSDDTSCPKCGCNIEKAIAEREEIENAEPVTFLTKIKNLPLVVKILIPVIIIAIIAAVNISSRSKAEEMRKNVVKYAALYDEQLNEAVDAIGIIANEYKNGVYDRDWNMQIENAQELRRVLGDEINEITVLREPIVHTREKIRENGGDKIGVLADKVYYAYRSCYEYVILEGGGAKDYMKNYLILVDDFNMALDEFNKEAEKYK